MAVHWKHLVDQSPLLERFVVAAPDGPLGAIPRRSRTCGHTLNLLRYLLAASPSPSSAHVAYTPSFRRARARRPSRRSGSAVRARRRGPSTADASTRSASARRRRRLRLQHYQFTHVRGHLDMVSSWWLPLAALFLLRTLA